MSKAERSVFAELTPPGRAAVATIALEGPNALELVAQFFQPASGAPLASFPIDRIVFGRWESAAATAPGEELCICRTSDRRFEIHCHGGTAATGAIGQALQAAGAEQLSTQQWIARNERDPHRAKALELLAEARTTRSAAILLDQTRGAFSQAWDAILGALTRGELSTAGQQVRRLLELAPLRFHLTRPFCVVLAGAPNVGKSSLINRLVGYQRSIVFDQPGTTRDVIAATTALDGWLVELRDTAGLRETTDPLEAEGSQRALRQVAEADLVVWVRDATQPEHDAGAGSIRAAKGLRVWNKCDLASPPPCDADADADAALAVSARTGAGLDELQRRIVARLCPYPPQPGEAVPLLEQHVERLVAIGHACESGDAAAALAACAALDEGKRC
jgi:tRNA modification GTPase